MSSTTTPQNPNSNLGFSIEMLRDEVYNLVAAGKVSYSQPIYVLCQFIPAREWTDVECELERHGYLLRDHVADLNPCQCWEND